MDPVAGTRMLTEVIEIPASFLFFSLRTLLSPRHLSAKLIKGSNGSREQGQPLLQVLVLVFIHNPSFLEGSFFHLLLSVNILNMGSPSRYDES